MTTLADVKTGDQFLFVCVTGTVDVNGIALELFGPSNVLAASAQINPDGSMAGQLMAAPDTIPVSLITGYVPFTVGDVLQKDASGETMVCCWSSIQPDGSTNWSASKKHEVIYKSDGWSIIGHINLTG
jgi:hypothetical protein